MEKMMMMTEEEYEQLEYDKTRLMATVRKLKMERDDARWAFQHEQTRSQNLWNKLNRPAIEEASAKRENDLYDWCAQKAEEYEEKDFRRWLEEKEYFYNTSGCVEFAQRHNINAVDEDVEDKKWELWANKHIIKYPTEGWTDLDGMWTHAFGHRNHQCNLKDKDNTWILAAAKEDAYNRYQECKNSHDTTNERKYYRIWDGLWHIWSSLYPEYGNNEFYR